MKEIKIDFAGGPEDQDLAAMITAKYGPPLMIGSLDGMNFAVLSLRFGTFSVDGNITVLFPATKFGDVAISYALAPQLSMVPQYPDHLNYVCIATSYQEISNEELTQLIGAGVQIIGMSNVLPDDGTDTVDMPIEFGAPMLRTDSDKERGIFPCGAIVCVPTSAENIARNKMMVSMSRIASELVDKVADATPAANGVPLH